jgi:hypothetical protein
MEYLYILLKTTFLSMNFYFVKFIYYVYLCRKSEWFSIGLIPMHFINQINSNMKLISNLTLVVLLLIAITAAPVDAFAQQAQMLTGIVLYETEPVIGANVTVPGTAIGMDTTLPARHSPLLLPQFDSEPLGVRTKRRMDCRLNFPRPVFPTRARPAGFYSSYK